MVRTKANRANLSHFAKLEQIFMTGHIKRADYLLFSNLLLSGERLTSRDRDRLGRLFDHLRLGRIKWLD